MVGRVLVVSARMGAGHDGAARELCRRLEERGVQTKTVDFLDSAPWAGRLIKAIYEWQLRAAPWAYEATYRVWFLGPLLCAPAAALLSLVFGARLRRWASEFEANAVVSTYPLASVVLGRLRRRRYRALRAPAVTFVTDFAVHPLWVHPGVDLNLCVHPHSADQAARTTGRASRAPGPLVSERFRAGLPERQRARQELGLPEQAQVVLVVAGSWGVGELETTFDALLASGRYLPVAVCGTNEALRRRLAARGAGLVLGWTDAMPALMAAADVLVQNAGGLTCMEAFAAGLPVVSFRPIPGHGRQNAIDMDRAGVAAFVAGTGELSEVLDHVVSGGGHMATLGRAMFRGDAAEDVARVARTSVPLTLPARHPVRRGLVAAGLALASLYAGINVGADAATAHGIDAAQPPQRSHAVYLAVRLGAADLDDPTLAPLLARDRVTAVVEGALAGREPLAVRRLARSGVNVANGGWGAETTLHVILAQEDVTRSGRALARAMGHPCLLYAPESAVNGFDLASARADHEVIVRPARLLVDTGLPPAVRPDHVYILDAETTTGPELARHLAGLEQALSARGIATYALSALR